MNIFKIKENKKQYIDLLLLADEQESMIDRYLDRGTMFLLTDDGARAVCVVTNEGNGILEIKNLAVAPGFRRRGYGKRMLDFITQAHKNRYRILQVGIGDSPLTLPFYEKCGFTRSHIVKNFFTDNYDHPIFECGIQLKDMIYLKKLL